jgi:hypothetical protein
LRGGCPLPPPPPNGQRKNKTNEDEHQVTDVRFAKIGKDACKITKEHRRRLHRLMGKKQKAATSLIAKHTDMMAITLAI